MLLRKFEVMVINEETLRNAFEVSSKYQFGFWDSIIIESALESKCDILYSEDFHHLQIIDNRLTILNPFK